MQMREFTCEDCGEQFIGPVRVGMPLSSGGVCLLCRKRNEKLTIFKFVASGVVALLLLTVVLVLAVQCG